MKTNNLETKGESQILFTQEIGKQYDKLIEDSKKHFNALKQQLLKSEENNKKSHQTTLDKLTKHDSDVKYDHNKHSKDHEIFKCKSDGIKIDLNELRIGIDELFNEIQGVESRIKQDLNAEKFTIECSGGVKTSIPFLEASIILKSTKDIKHNQIENHLRKNSKLLDFFKELDQKNK